MMNLTVAFLNLPKAPKKLMTNWITTHRILQNTKFGIAPSLNEQQVLLSLHHLHVSISINDAIIRDTFRVQQVTQDYAQ